ncbi:MULTISPECIES: metallophosphoesterase [unclassified Streptomyces]|uniref:metallophosphoesterase n=1 Tax=unclassified Streptomyces TaxID=2593676 RepID=UPI00203351E4|nr:MULTISPECIES: metallophosphoesterase [unclassified Streptomyces]MCM2421180.1 metallophosphoesterase [Streptomyces sp. RKAG293]MCM2426619.1 metallophosphoesterase [Streptomyces sp. RKAG337]
MVVVFVLGGLAVLALFAVLHRYLWRRLVRDVSAPRGWYRRIGTVLAFVLPLISLGALIGGRALPLAGERWLAWPGYLWLAVLIYLTFALLVGEAVRPLLRRALDRRAATRGNPEEAVPVAVPATATATAPAPEATATSAASPPTAPPPVPAATEDPAAATRRQFVARTVAVAAGAAAAGTVGYGMYGVLRGPRLKNVTVPLAKLPARADGYRIAVVSDIHLGPILGRAHTQRIVDTINGARPDLVAIVGDLVDGTVADLGPAAEPLAQLRSRHGSYFVTGNHEYFSGAAPWVDFVRELGVHPLENARVELPGFDLAGVNDISGADHHAAPDYGKALGDRDRTRAAVLLAHQPVMIHEAVKHGVDLQLSGHTHGGQLWPGNYIAELANPTVAGLDRYGDTQLYVTRGAGAWGPPVRVGAPSDITIVKLVSLRA